MTSTPDRAPTVKPTVNVYSPIPDVSETDERGRWHGGLKLDARSDVGRTGVLLDWWPVGRGENGVGSGGHGVDAGIPEAVARALAAGLCAAATVVGCTADQPDAAGPEWAPVRGGHALWYPGRRWLGMGAHPFGLLATREPGVVEQLLDDGWASESQVLFLTRPGTLPRLDRAAVEGCFPVPIQTTPAQLADAGVVGLLRAGVDGDVAGLYLLDPDVRHTVLRALADAVTAAGGHWVERDGAAYPSANVANAAGGPQ